MHLTYANAPSVSIRVNPRIKSLSPLLVAASLFGAVWTSVLFPVLHADPITLVLKPSADACLFESSPDNNLGASLSFPVGALSTGKRSRALVRFDVASAIPANSIIDAVELTIVLPFVGGGTASDPFELHRVFESWGEGSKTGNTGAPASAGEVRWDRRFHPRLDEKVT